MARTCILTLERNKTDLRSGICHIHVYCLAGLEIIPRSHLRDRSIRDRSGLYTSWMWTLGLIQPGLRSVPDRSTLFRAEWERKHVLKAIQLSSSSLMECHASHCRYTRKDSQRRLRRDIIIFSRSRFDFRLLEKIRHCFKNCWAAATGRTSAIVADGTQPISRDIASS